MNDRKIERGRGCWNCIHWDNGDGAKRNYYLRPDIRRSRIPRVGNNVDVAGASFSKNLGALMRHQKLSESAAIETLLDNQMHAAKDSLIDQAVDDNQIGLCRGGGLDAKGDKVDFTVAGMLCRKWSGVAGSSLATSGHALDKEPAEVRDDMEFEAEKRAAGRADDTKKKDGES